MSESSPDALVERDIYVGLCHMAFAGCKTLKLFLNAESFPSASLRDARALELLRSTVNINELNTWKLKLASFVIPSSNESIADIVSREMFSKHVLFSSSRKSSNFHSPGKKWYGRRSSFILRLNENWSFSAFLLKASKARENWNKYLPVRKIPGIRFAMPQNRWKMLKNFSPPSLRTTFSITLLFSFFSNSCVHEESARHYALFFRTLIRASKLMILYRLLFVDRDIACHETMKLHQLRENLKAAWYSMEKNL